MKNFRLQLNPDYRITVFGLQQKPRGVVLNPSLSSFVLMKYPRLAQGKLVSLSASELHLLMNKYYDS